MGRLKNRFPWSYLLICSIAAVAGAILIAPQDWANNRSALLVAFGIQGAAILTRLGRGHPVSDISHLTLDQVDRLNTAVERVASEQHRAALITFVATLLTIVATGLSTAAETLLRYGVTLIPRLAPFLQSLSTAVWPLIVGITIFLIAAAFSYLPSILKQDIGLIRLQSQFKKEAVEKARSKSGAAKADADRNFRALSELKATLEGSEPTVRFGEIRTRRDPE